MTKITLHDPSLPNTTLHDLPDLGRNMQAMRIIKDVEMKLAGKENLFALTIKQAIKDNKPYVEIIKTIRESAEDNVTMVVGQIGLYLTKEIANF